MWLKCLEKIIRMKNRDDLGNIYNNTRLMLRYLLNVLAAELVNKIFLKTISKSLDTEHFSVLKFY